MALKRVRYYPGQLLTHRDQLDEQAYLLDQLRTAIRILHRTGVINGLHVTTLASETVIGPGAAVDPSGRIITLESPLSITTPAATGPRIVSIRVVEVASDPVAVPASHGDQTEYSRWTDEVVVSIEESVPPGAIPLAVIDIHGTITMITTVRTKPDRPVPPESASEIETAIKKKLAWVTFEPNNSTLWARAREEVAELLHQKWTTGVLIGATPQEAFFVRVDETTMTHTDRDAGRLLVEIGLALTEPGQFHLLRIGLRTTGS